MNQIQIEVNLSKEDRARIDTITNVLIDILSNRARPEIEATMPEKVEPKATTPEEKKAALLAESKPVDEPLPFPEEPKEEKTFQPTLDAIRGLVTTLVNAGKKNEAKAIIIGSGKDVKSVSGVPTEKYAEVYNQLKEVMRKAAIGG